MEVEGLISQQSSGSRSYKKMAIAAVALLGVVGVVAVAFTGTAAPINAVSVDQDMADFNEWMFQYEKEYSHEEYDTRF